MKKLIFLLSFAVCFLTGFSQATTGTRLSAPVVPNDSSDVYPTHYEGFGQGGYRTVATIAQRNLIKPALRTEGMLVMVLSDGQTYQLRGGITNANWVSYSDLYVNATVDDILGNSGAVIFIFLDVDTFNTHGHSLSYLWSNSETDKRIMIASPGIYTVRVTDNVTNKSVYSSVTAYKLFSFWTYSDTTAILATKAYVRNNQPWTNNTTNIKYLNRVGIGGSADATAKLNVTGTVNSTYLTKMVNSSSNGGCLSLYANSSATLASFSNDGVGTVLDLSGTFSGKVLTIDGATSSGFTTTINASNSTAGGLNITNSIASSFNLFKSNGATTVYNSAIENTGTGGGLTIKVNSTALLNIIQAVNSGAVETFAVKANGGIKQLQKSGSLTDGIPTASEITTVVGSSPATVGAGYHIVIKDSDGTGKLYRVESDGATWSYLVMVTAL